MKVFLNITFLKVIKQHVFEIYSDNWPSDKMACSVNITNESTGTSTASDDTYRTSFPFQSRDKGR